MQPGSESATVTAPQQGISREEFAFETRFVVLNYLGQLQNRTSSDGSFSSSSGSGIAGRRLHTQSSSSSGSSHQRPTSVSPRAPSVSPRHPEGDSEIVGAQAYDAKMKTNQAIVQRGKTQDSKDRLNAEILQRRQMRDQQTKRSDQITHSDPKEDSNDCVDYDVYESRKKTSEILEKKSREARVLEELKNLAKTRIEEIRATYDDTDKKQSGITPGEATGMLPQGVMGMVPSMVDDAPSPSLYEDYGMAGYGSLHLDYDKHIGGNGSEQVGEMLSPTRPNALDGLHKTSDLFGETCRRKSAQPRGYIESRDETIAKRDGIPRPQPLSREKSPAKRDGIPRPPPPDKVSKDNIAKRDSTRSYVQLDRELSRESEYSDMDSPLSDRSSLTWSGRSVVSAATSSRSSVVNLNESQVKALVKTSVLPEVAVPLQEEITEQWQQYEREYEQAYHESRKSSITKRKTRPPLRVIITEPTASTQSDSVRGMSPMMSNTGPLSPESEVARKLGIIGDRIQEEMGELLDKAFNDVMAIPREQVTYEVLRGVVEEDRLLQNSSGWRQVAVLLAFSQRLTLGLLQKGERGLGKLMDYSVRLIEDKAAEFIINQGGWGAISELDVSPLVSPTDDNLVFPVDTSGAQAGPDIQHAVDQVGINAVGSLLDNLPERTLDTAIYVDHNFGSSAVGGIFHDGEATDGGRIHGLVTDGAVRDEAQEYGATGGLDYVNSGNVPPDLLPSGFFSGSENIEGVRPEIVWIRSISHEITKEAEEARTHRFVTRLTWGSIAVVVFAVGLTVLWKWKSKNVS